MPSQLNAVWSVDPLKDERWSEFVDKHSNSSVFHTIGWLKALRATYGYEPVAFTTSAPSDKLTNAVLFCDVKSRFTGRRLVSLPFSDHCEPLVQDAGQLQELCAHLQAIERSQRLKYVEMRTGGELCGANGGFRERIPYRWHRLNLRPSLDALYKGFHRDCIRRRIRHAQRQGMRFEEGRNKSLLRSFYALIVLTRLRKHLPPQPFEWFQNLVACIGEDVCIRVAFKGERPVAGILTLDHGKKVYYKYGGSDAGFNKLGGTPMLFWQAIQAAKAAGMEELDFGRSEFNNQGLVRFKERWSAEEFPLMTWRAPTAVTSPSTDRMKLQMAKKLCSWLPEKILILAGRLLYKHIG